MRELLSWLKSFWPAPLPAGRRERVFGGVGALVGLLVTELIGRHTLGASSPWFVAPMGASAVLLFAVPSSPLAQPWSIVGGNLVSALAGIACAQWVDHPGLAAPLAVGLAIALMFQLRCLHPPGGAVALTWVIGGPAVTGLGFGFALAPVTLNSACLLLVALLFNGALRRRYPHRAHEPPPSHATSDPPPSARLGITPDDLRVVLEERGEVVDISSEDLEEILQAVERRAWRRRFGELCCRDVMAKDLVRIAPDAPLDAAWKLLARHRVKTLPVVGAANTLVGIISLHDLMLSQGTSRQTVGEAMTADVVTARPEQSILELVPAFSDRGLHHMPVVDEDGAVVGMLTQSDLVAALFRAGLDRALGGA